LPISGSADNISGGFVRVNFTGILRIYPISPGLLWHHFLYIRGDVDHQIQFMKKTIAIVIMILLGFYFTLLLLLHV